MDGDVLTDLIFLTVNQLELALVQDQSVLTCPVIRKQQSLNQISDQTVVVSLVGALTIQSFFFKAVMFGGSTLDHRCLLAAIHLLVDGLLGGRLGQFL